MNIEDKRQSFRPDRITALFLGESAPRSGRSFYQQNTGLYRAMQSAFHSQDDFLIEFKARGYYLDDLSLIPVNGMSRTERTKQCETSIPSLAHRLRDYRPAAIVILIRRIDRWIREAAKQVDLAVPIYNTTYPGRFQSLRQQFQNEMAVIIPQLSASR